MGEAASARSKIDSSEVGYRSALAAESSARQSLGRGSRRAIPNPFSECQGVVALINAFNFLMSPRIDSGIFSV